MKLTPEYIQQVNNIRLRRKLLEISIKEIAEYIGISRSAVSQYEGFKASLGKNTILKIEEYLDTKRQR